LGPTGYGDSPYQCFSAFAGNPLLISLEGLADEGLLASRDLKTNPAFPAQEVEYGSVAQFKLPLLDKAFAKFEAEASPSQRDAFAAFCRDQAFWLDDFALFMALKRVNAGRPWHRWDEGVGRREGAALAAARKEHGREARSRQFAQHTFFRQWEALRAHCHGIGIRLMGDIPIFVAHDSSDVWSHPELFHLAADGRPSSIAGVPPDYFSATGQCWGNPLYRWEVMARDGYKWW